jgi:hypothetical protein
MAQDGSTYQSAASRPVVSRSVCLIANTLGATDLGGHLWVYLNWALGLQEAGCDVVWLEVVEPGMEDGLRREATRVLASRLAAVGLAGCLRIDTDGLDDIYEADLVLNLRYEVPERLTRAFHRSALVDIDPGLLQSWMAAGQVEVPPHDLYITTGETVGTKAALFPDCGHHWFYTPPPVHLRSWPVVSPSDPPTAYTTISSWWGDEWLRVGDELLDNNKRRAFLDHLDVAERTPVALELALSLGESAEEQADVLLLRKHGWQVRDAWSVSSTPDLYRNYIHGSRGEFSCAKPCYGLLQTAWVSDRTVCYLASGLPAVVEHTGISSFLPDARGLFRFGDVDGAVRALDRAESDYSLQCREARSLAEEFFDAGQVLRRVLEVALP